MSCVYIQYPAPGMTNQVANTIRLRELHSEVYSAMGTFLDIEGVKRMPKALTSRGG